MMAWSVKPGQAHLDKDSIRQIKSPLTNDIFQQELLADQPPYNFENEDEQLACELAGRER